MSDMTAEQQHEFLDKTWKLLNVQADTMLKWSQTRTEVWKVAVGAMTAGAALLTAGAAIEAALGRLL